MAAAVEQQQQDLPKGVTRPSENDIGLMRLYCEHFPEKLCVIGDPPPQPLAAAGAAQLTPQQNMVLSQGDSAFMQSVGENPALASTGESAVEQQPPPPSDTYRLQHPIGRNQSTAVFSAERIRDRLPVVVKFVTIDDPKSAGYAQGEIRCLANCQHFTIIKQFECMYRGTVLLMVLEYGSGGDLSKQLKQRVREKVPFREQEAALLFFQLVLAVDHVHAKRMIHRDIKSANLFLMPTGVMKLGDFGLSKMYEESVSKDVGKSFCGTPYYLAPEIWKRDRYSKKADMWSVGVVLYELLTSERPFKGPSQTQIMEQVLTGAYDPLPAEISVELAEMVAMLLKTDPNERPNTTQVLALPFMQYVRSLFEEIVTLSRLIDESTKAEVQEAMTNLKSRTADVSTHADSAVLLPVTEPVRFSGYLWKLGSDRRFKKRYFAILNDNQLRISISENPENDGCEPQTAPTSLILDVLPVPRAYTSAQQPYQLTVWFSATKKMVAAAETEAMRDMWIQALHEITECSAQR